MTKPKSKLKLVGGTDIDDPKIVWKVKVHQQICPNSWCSDWIVWREFYVKGSPPRSRPRERFRQCCRCAANQYVEENRLG